MCSLVGAKVESLFINCMKSLKKMKSELNLKDSKRKGKALGGNSMHKVEGVGREGDH